MDNYWKDKWVTALRSGDYNQVTGTLCRPKGSHVIDQQDGVEVKDAFCCLGVMCDIMPNTTKEIIDDDGDGPSIEYTFKGYTGIGRLPNSLRNAIDISVGEETDLVSLNDDDGYTFDEIADYIEDNL